MAIDLSAIQFQQSDIVDKIIACLASSGLPSQCLEIELTESAAFADPDMAVSRLQAMRQHGLHMAIDDFGTGYSSLSYLQRIRFDTLKIDRAFVGGLCNGSQGEGDLLLDAMISMAKARNITVLAEGVETKAQLDWLRKHGCDVTQGYLVCKPAPALAIESWLSGRTSVPVAQGADRLSPAQSVGVAGAEVLDGTG